MKRVLAFLFRRPLLWLAFGLILGVAGLGVGVSGWVVSLALLPPLLFEAGLNLPYRQWRDEAVHILGYASLAFVGTFGLAAILGHMFLGLAWRPALFFADLLAATDPVAVVALFRARWPGSRLVTVLQGESLFNDGTALVVYLVLLQPGGLARIPLLFCWVAGGGLVLGWAFGQLRRLKAGRPRYGPLAAYGSALLAAAVGMSAALPPIVAGIIWGGKAKEPERRYWGMAAKILDSILFFLLGLAAGGLAWRVAFGSMVLATVIILFARGASVFALTPLFNRWRPTAALSWAEQAFLTIGGLKGAVALAVATGLPRHLEDRQLVVTLGLGATILGFVVQIPVFSRWLGGRGGTGGAPRRPRGPGQNRRLAGGEQDSAEGRTIES